MKIRRLQYSIDYVHILTFREEYKAAIIPYFGFENVEYAIDNDNTINEGIRLIFKTELIEIFFRKEGIILVFEGNVEELKDQNGPIKIFWEIYEKTISFKGYRKTTRHTLIVHAVEIQDKAEVDKTLENNPYLILNPFGKLEEFSCAYEFQRDQQKIKFAFGNYSEKDIKKHDLMPFKVPYNDELIDAVGLMGRQEISEIENKPNFSKFKSLLNQAEHIFSSYKLD